MKFFTAYIHENRYGLGIILLAAIFLLPFLGAFPLIDPDEPVYGQTAREMLAAGDWLSPRIYGQFWYDKPPLFYWLEMISYSLFGGERNKGANTGQATADEDCNASVRIKQTLSQLEFLFIKENVFAVFQQ